MPSSYQKGAGEVHFEVEYWTLLSMCVLIFIFIFIEVELLYSEFPVGVFVQLFLSFSHDMT